MSYMKPSQEMGLGVGLVAMETVGSAGVKEGHSWSPLLFLKQKSLEATLLASLPPNRAVPIRVLICF